MLIALVIAVVVLLHGAIAWVRSLGHDVATWPVDPTAPPDPRIPTWLQVAPAGPTQAPVLAVGDDL